GSGAYLGVGVLKSTDAGQTWQRVSNETLPSPAETVDIVVDPQDSDRLYLAQYSHLSNGTVFASGFLASTDGGVNWVSKYKALSRSLVRTPKNTKFLYMGMPGVDKIETPPPGLYHFLDSGDTWSQFFPSPYPTTKSNFCAAVSPADPNSIFIY